MLHPFQALRSDYEHCLAVMRVKQPNRVRVQAERLLGLVDRYRPVYLATGVPVAWLAAIDYRESENDPRAYLGNGDRIIGTGQRSRHVPAGRGPFATWADGAIDALEYDHISAVREWDWPRACYEAELWNGFGPRDRGRRSGYLWAGTNLYAGGGYPSDGRWMANYQDERLGAVPLMLEMVRQNPALALGALPAPDWDVPHAPPAVPPAGVHSAAALQAALNRLGFGPLAEDGSYGRRTAAAVRRFQAAEHLTQDGLAGPATWAKLDELARAGD